MKTSEIIESKIDEVAKATAAKIWKEFKEKINDAVVSLIRLEDSQEVKIKMASNIKLALNDIVIYAATGDVDVKHDYPPQIEDHFKQIIIDKMLESALENSDTN